MARRNSKNRRSDQRQMSLWDWSERALSPISEVVPVGTPKSAVAGRRSVKQHRSSAGYHAGVAAELSVAQDYERRGYAVARRRWRGAAGEIDLICRDGDDVIFVEVKKSRSFDRALDRLSVRQISRLQTAAEEFLGSEPKGLLTDVRFDVALVDAHGQMRVLENAFA